MELTDIKGYYRYDMDLSLNPTGDMRIFTNRHGNCRKNDGGHFFSFLKINMQHWGPRQGSPKTLPLVLRFVLSGRSHTPGIYVYWLFSRLQVRARVTSKKVISDINLIWINFVT